MRDNDLPNNVQSAYNYGLVFPLLSPANVSDQKVLSGDGGNFPMHFHNFNSQNVSPDMSKIKNLCFIEIYNSI